MDGACPYSVPLGGGEGVVGHVQALGTKTELREEAKPAVHVGDSAWSSGTAANSAVHRRLLGCDSLTCLLLCDRCADCPTRIVFVVLSAPRGPGPVLLCGWEAVTFKAATWTSRRAHPRASQSPGGAFGPQLRARRP